MPPPYSPFGIAPSKFHVLQRMVLDVDRQPHDAGPGRQPSAPPTISKRRFAPAANHNAAGKRDAVNDQRVAFSDFFLPGTARASYQKLRFFE